MPATVKNSSGGSSTSAPISFTPTFPASTSSTNIVYFWIVFSNAAVTNITCTGWTAITSNPIVGAAHLAVLFRRRIQIGDTEPTLSWTTGSTYSWVMVSCRDADTNVPEEDHQESTAGAATAHIVPASTALSNSGLWLGFVGSDNPGAATTSSYTWPGGTTELQDQASVNVAPASCAWRSLVAPGAVASVTATCTENQDYSSAVVIVRAANGIIAAPPRVRRALLRR